MEYIETKAVRFEKEDGVVTGIYYYEIACDSSETKPTENIADGSIITETDTGNVYFFNEKTGSWVKQFSFQG